MALLRADSKDLHAQVETWREKYWKLWEEAAKERITHADVLAEVSRLQRDVDRLEKERSARPACPFSECPLEPAGKS